MSNSFTSSTTRGMEGYEREVESRKERNLARRKRLDRFTDDFSPPGATDAQPGADYTKGKIYGQAHDDATPKVDLPIHAKADLAAAGNAIDQKELDDIDREANQHETPIKKESDQFPGSALKGGLGLVSKKLKNEIQKDMGKAK